MKRYLSRIPRRNLVIGGAAALTVGAFVTLGCVLFHVIMGLSTSTEELAESHRLHADISEHYAHRESALLLALKAGGSVWAEQVGESDAKLRAALSGYMAKAPAASDAAKHAQDALTALDVMARHEGPALDLVRQGDRSVGLKSIANREFYDADAAVKASIDQLLDTAIGQAAVEAANARRTAIIAWWATAVVVVVILVAWYLLLRDMARQAQLLANAKKDLEVANAELELRSRQREASFFEDSPIPTLESDFSAVLDEMQKLRDAGVTDIDAWLDEHPKEVFRLRSLVRLQRINTAAVNLFGVKDAETFLQNPGWFFKEEHIDSVRSHLVGMFRGDRDFFVETLVYGYGRRTIPVYFYSRPVRGAELTFDSVITSIVDVTDLKDAEAAADAAKIAAESASQAKSEFLAAMSHEIRTPLNGVLGMASVLSRADLGPKEKELVRVIEDSGTALLAILNDLLDLSKIEAGRFELDETPFDIADVVAGAEALFTPRAAEKGLALRLNISPDAQGVYIGDPTRLRQILYNLLSNAVKFTDEGSVLVTVDAEDDGGRLVIRVADTGPGVPPERMAELFLPFRQGEMSTTRRHGGTGLGLSICKQLAQLMGGDVTAASESGRGSTFTVTLRVERCVDVDPVRERDLVAEDFEAAPESALRILVAEDNPTNRKVIEAVMEPAHASITMVENGEEAVAAWEAGEFDLVLMDVQMPVMDGLAATRAIRARECEEGRARTPILALTANAMNHQVKDYIDAGMDAHVSKPIEPARLFQTVRAVLNDAAAGTGRAGGVDAA